MNLYFSVGNEKEEESRFHTIQRLSFNMVITGEFGRKFKNCYDRSN